GRSAEGFEEDVRFSLEALYPRLAKGAAVLLADYCEPDAYDRPGYHFPWSILSRRHWAQYPQVKRACDAFLKGKPEVMVNLYAGLHSPGAFRKQEGRVRRAGRRGRRSRRTGPPRR